VTYRRISTLILQSDGQGAPLSEKRTGVSAKARAHVKVSSSTLVFQREFQQVLAIAEKRIDARVYEIAEEARAKFPDATEGDQLEAFLASHRDITHAFLWTGKGHLEVQSQPDQMNDSDPGREDKELASMLGSWFDMDSKDWIAKVKKLEAMEGRRVYLTSNWVL
jgi:hypothetical protein